MRIPHNVYSCHKVLKEKVYALFSYFYLYVGRHWKNFSILFSFRIRTETSNCWRMVIKPAAPILNWSVPIVAISTVNQVGTVFRHLRLCINLSNATIIRILCEHVSISSLGMLNLVYIANIGKINLTFWLLSHRAAGWLGILLYSGFWKSKNRVFNYILYIFRSL